MEGLGFLKETEGMYAHRSLVWEKKDSGFCDRGFGWSVIFNPQSLPPGMSGRIQTRVLDPGLRQLVQTAGLGANQHGWDLAAFRRYSRGLVVGEVDVET